MPVNAMDVNIKIEGLKELMDSMQNFVSPKLQQKLVQGSVKTAANVVKQEAERRLGKGKGYIGMAAPKKKKWGAGAVAVMGIGVKKKHWQVWFQEWNLKGHEIIAGTRRKKKTGKKILYEEATGKFFGKKVHIPYRAARPFLRPAIDSKKEEALKRMKEFLETAMKAIFMARQRDIQEPPVDLS